MIFQKCLHLFDDLEQKWASDLYCIILFWVPNFPNRERNPVQWHKMIFGECKKDLNNIRQDLFVSLYVSNILFSTMGGSPGELSEELVT